MPDGDSSDEHPAIGGSRTSEHNAALAIIVKEVRRIGEKVDAIHVKLADGQTQMALQNQRLNDHGDRISSLQIGHQTMRDEMRTQVADLRDHLHASQCNDCEPRIDALEAKERDRAKAEELARESKAAEEARGANSMRRAVGTAVACSLAVSAIGTATAFVWWLF